MPQNAQPDRGTQPTTLRLIEVMLFPYLPLSARLTVGPWELIPKSHLAATDVRAAEMVDHAHGVAALYAMPGDSRGFGAFVRHLDRRVGDEIDRTQLSPLHDAVVVPLIDPILRSATQTTKRTQTSGIACARPRTHFSTATGSTRISTRGMRTERCW
jgi:hypothetical protein